MSWRSRRIHRVERGRGHAFWRTSRSSDRVGDVTQLRHHSAERADEEGLRGAFLSHGAEMLGFARRSLHSPGHAQDAVQETFARAWRSRTRFDPSLGSLRTWLFTIERQAILDVATRLATTRTVSMAEAQEPAPEDRLEAAMLGWQMESALQRLKPEHRMIITELYVNGRSGRDVAQLFAILEGTVRSRAFQTLRVLRISVEEAGWVR